MSRVKLGRGAHASAFGALLLACLASLARSPGVAVASRAPSDTPGTLNVDTPGPSEVDPSLALASIDDEVKDAIADGKMPGAVVVVGRRDRVLFRRAYGFRQLQPERARMTIDTLFDLASLTKPVATATSVMVLAEEGRLGLDDSIAKHVPECAAGGKRAITLRHLLLHTSGLPADTPEDDFEHGRDEAIRRICNVPLRAAPGAKSIYSDVGFVLLEEVVRRVTSEELPVFARRTIFAPLGMIDTDYVPPEPRRRRAAWTELVDGTWRAGVVHDPRAFRLGGVAGHAGLFSTADDLARYARTLLAGGQVDGRRVLTERSVAAMIAPEDVPGGVRALGWQVESTWKGAGLSPRAVGHFGFTGTALWVDPDKDLFTVVLTNRVHPDGTGDAKPLVSRINTIAAEAVGLPVDREEALR